MSLPFIISSVVAATENENERYYDKPSVAVVVKEIAKAVHILLRKVELGRISLPVIYYVNARQA